MGHRANRTVSIGVAAVIALLVVACGPPPPPPPPPPAENPISLGNANTLGDGAAGSAAVSADGSIAVFTSAATNLVAGDTNGTSDLFARDRTTGVVTRLVEGVGGDVTVSTNGRYVGYRTSSDVAVHDRVTGDSAQWTPPSSLNTRPPLVSADGSAAVFGATTSLGAFATYCKVRDMTTGEVTDCPPGGPGFGNLLFEAVSANARFVLYSWDDQAGGGTDGRFLWDRELDTTTQLTQPVLAFPETVSISDDGRYIAAPDLTDPLTPTVHDLQTGTSVPFPVLPSDTVAWPVEISADGSTVLVLSDSAELVPGDTNGASDLFSWDIQAGTVERISVTASGGAELSESSWKCGPGPGQILADGSAACVLTDAAIVATDTNGTGDAYLLP